jgi:uncharacterized protein YggE
MDTYVDVTGSTELVETVSQLRADLELIVRASHADTAVREAMELRNQCIRKLKEAGLGDADLQEGGAQAWRPWFWKKAAGQEAAQKILVSCSEARVLYRALSSLEPLFEKSRHTIAVTMRQPQFSATPSIKEAALRAAIADARGKAESLAAEAGLRLTGVIQIEELSNQTGRSGMYGDEDWRGPIAIAAAPRAASDAGQYESLEGATRNVTIRCRVRFSVQQA